MERYREIALAFLINIIAGLILWAVTQEWLSVLILLLVGGIITFFIYLYSSWSFRNVGFISWSEHRGDSKSFRSSLESANYSIDFLASWGGTILSLSPNIELTIRDMIQQGIQFRFMLLKPGSPGELKRRLTRGTWPQGKLETDIRWLLHIKESLGTSSGNFRIALYSDEPVWALVIIDNIRAVVGFYSKGTGRHNPGLVVKKRNKRASFFEAFKLEYERLWAKSQELHSITEFESLIRETRSRLTRGFVFAITGPSGAGKTTLCRDLIQHGIGIHSNTITTRSARPGETETGQYTFVSEEEFESLSNDGKLLCETEFINKRYGISVEMVFEAIEAGKILILETIIPPRLLKERLGDQVVIVFLATSSLRILTERIRTRPDVNDADLKSRMDTAREQLSDAKYCDYILFNDGELSLSTEILRHIATSITNSYYQLGNFYPEEIDSLRANTVIREKGLPIDEYLV